VHIELLRQLGQRLLSLHGRKGHLRFEGRRMISARSLAHRLSQSAATLAAIRQEIHSASLSRFPEPPHVDTTTGRPNSAASRSKVSVNKRSFSGASTFSSR